MKPYSQPHWNTKVKKIQHGKLLNDWDMPIARICDLVTPGIEPVFIIELEVEVVVQAREVVQESQWQEMMNAAAKTANGSPLTVTYDDAQVTAGPITLSVAVNNDGWCLVAGPIDNENAYITGRQIGKSTFQAAFLGPSVLTMPKPPAFMKKCLGSPDPEVLKKAIADNLEERNED